MTQDACKRAAARVVMALSQVGLGDVEHLVHHLDPTTGFLSIDVINVLGASVLGIHVDGDSVPWPSLQADRTGAALVNWKNKHWTVLRCEPATEAWVHTNNILGDGLRYGRVACPVPATS